MTYRGWVPSTRRQVYRRRRIAVGAAATLVLVGGAYLPMTLLAPLEDTAPSLLATPEFVSTPVAFDLPAYGASGIAAIDRDGLLASAGSTDPHPIASITKVITALVVLSQHPLGADEAGPEITFTEDDERFYFDQVADGGSAQGVSAGVVMPLRDVLETVLLPSANNYAQSLAAWAFGSEEAYVDAANAWLAERGMTGTSVVDASGVDPRNVSTIPDLVALAKLALDDPAVAQVVSTTTADVPYLGTVENSNSLLGRSGVDGIKTGTLDEAGSCLLFSTDVVVGGYAITLVGAVLGGPDRATINAAIETLIAQATAGYREVTLVTAGDVLSDYKTIWEESAAAVAAETLTVLTWSADPIMSALTVEPVGFAEHGTVVGTITFDVGTTSYEVPLELENGIEGPDGWWRLSHPLELF